jgi:hypothetical protein
MVVKVGQPGDDADPGPLVGCSNVGSAYSEPRCIVPERGKSLENLIESPFAKECDVFEDHVRGLELFDDSRALEEKTASRTVEASSLARAAEILAGTAETKHTDSSEVVHPDAVHVSKARRCCPVLFEDFERIFVLFDLPEYLGVFTECPVEPELKAAHSAAQRAYGPVGHGRGSVEGQNPTGFLCAKQEVVYGTFLRVCSG